jgi:transposase InsO family protein
MPTAAAQIELMNSRVGRGRGQAVEATGPQAPGTIGSAPATLMMSRAPQSAHHRTNTRLQPIAANPHEPPIRRLRAESIHVFTRRIVGFGVESDCVDGVSVCRIFNRASARQRLPRRASTDHDPLFRFHRWLANLRVLEIEEIKTVPYAPVSHPFVERLIGTIRREYLDQTFFWNAEDLVRKLEEFRDYYNAHRVHRSLDGTTPAQCAGALCPAPAALDHYGWQQHCRGLFELPIAA